MLCKATHGKRQPSTILLTRKSTAGAMMYSNHSGCDVDNNFRSSSSPLPQTWGNGIHTEPYTAKEHPLISCRPVPMPIVGRSRRFNACKTRKVDALSVRRAFLSRAEDLDRRPAPSPPGWSFPWFGMPSVRFHTSFVQPPELHMLKATRSKRCSFRFWCSQHLARRHARLRDGLVVEIG